MAKPNEKLAESLVRLRNLQEGGRMVVRSSELTRVHRERLIKSGYLREAIKGWLISSSPDSDPGDTTPWFASYWEFCAAYCTSRFGKDWRLSPEQSLLLHAENAAIPKQVVVHALKGANNRINLPFGTSLYDLQRKDMPPNSDLAERGGLRLFAPNAALVRVQASFFILHPVEARVALSGVRDASEVLVGLLDGSRPAAAGRLAGAFRRTGRGEVSDEIVGVMKRAGYDVRESDPFDPEKAPGSAFASRAPIIGRLQALWEAMREPVIEIFPEAPGPPVDAESYLSFVDDIYRLDAYHSLSIEGYRVTPELIERVSEGNWNPDGRDIDRQNRDALAASGYWQAFRLVREAVGEIIGGTDAATHVRKAHGDWYRELFQPGILAGLIAESALVGYRGHSVFLRGSRHVPPRWETVRDAMPALFDLMESESEPSVRAVLGHWLFGYVHPYPDGNGRMARFVMNAMLASGGYPWTVIRVEDRDAYLATLESASVDQDIAPFARFLAERVRQSQERAARATTAGAAPF